MNYWAGYTLAALGGFLVGAAVWGHPRVRRFVLWNARCLRGRRCATIVFGGLGGDEEPLPAGSIAVFNYCCQSCGTGYRLTTMFGADGHWTDSGRQHVSAADAAQPPHIEVPE